MRVGAPESGGVGAMIPTLSTTRLTLRGPALADFDIYAEILMSPRAEFIGGPFTRKGAWLDFCQETASWQLRGYGGFTAFRDDQILGFVGLHLEYGDPERELGWVFTPEAEGHGYAHEAAHAVRDFAYDQLGWTTLVSYIAPGNTRSIRLAERMGAVHDKTAKRPEDFPDVLVYRHPAPEKLQ